MLYEDDVTVHYRIVPHWGTPVRMAPPVRSTFTHQQLDDVAPVLTQREQDLLRENRPPLYVQMLIQERIEAARRLKYGQRRP